MIIDLSEARFRDANQALKHGGDGSSSGKGGLSILCCRAPTVLFVREGLPKEITRLPPRGTAKVHGNRTRHRILWVELWVRKFLLRAILQGASTAATSAPSVIATAFIKFAAGDFKGIISEIGNDNRAGYDDNLFVDLQSKFWKTANSHIHGGSLAINQELAGYDEESTYEILRSSPTVFVMLIDVMYRLHYEKSNDVLTGNRAKVFA